MSGDVAERLKLLRKSKGFTQKEVASGIGVGYSTYQGYEIGRHPSRKNIEKLSSFFGCSLAWLISGEGLAPEPDKTKIPNDSQPQESIAQHIDFANRIKFLRSKKGVTQKVAAEGIGVSFSAYQGYEAGHTPSTKNLERIFKYYGCSKDWLLIGEGPIYPKSSVNASETTETPNEESGLLDTDFDLRDIPPTEFWAAWNEYINLSEARRGWMQVEIIEKFPDFTEWLKKRRGVAFKGELEGSEAVA